MKLSPTLTVHLSVTLLLGGSGARCCLPDIYCCIAVAGIVVCQLPAARALSCSFCRSSVLRPILLPSYKLTLPSLQISFYTVAASLHTCPVQLSIYLSASIKPLLRYNNCLYIIMCLSVYVPNYLLIDKVCPSINLSVELFAN